MHEMQQRLDVDPQWMGKLVGHFEHARNPFEVIKTFGFSLHPEVAPLLCDAQGRKAHVSLLWRPLQNVLYRLSGHDQFRSTHEVTKANEAKARKLAAQRKQAQRAEEAKMAPQDLSRNSSVLTLMREHLASECRRHGVGFGFSLRCSSNPRSPFHTHVSTLEDHLQTPIGQQVRGVPVLQAPLSISALQQDQACEEAFEWNPEAAREEAF